MTMDPLNYTLRHNFPGFLGKAASLAIEYDRAARQISGSVPEITGTDLEFQTQVHLRLLCDLSRPESYDFGYRELQHNLGLTTDEMTWTRIFRACKIRKPASGTTTRGEAMKICLEASLAIAAERNKICQHTFLDNQHADKKVVDPYRDISLRMWLAVFCVVAVSVFCMAARAYWQLFG